LFIKIPPFGGAVLIYAYYTIKTYIFSITIGYEIPAPHLYKITKGNLKASVKLKKLPERGAF